MSENGVLMEITTIVDAASARQYTTSLIAVGTKSSMELMSLLNRFIKRPMGTDSKNCMPDRRIECNILLWKLRDDKITIAIEIISCMNSEKSGRIAEANEIFDSL